MAQRLGDLLPVLQLTTVAMFALLALVAVTGARHGGRAERWAAVTFGSLASVLLIDTVGAALSVGPLVWLQEATVILLIAFPYLLLRFTACFCRFPRRLEVAAAAAAASLAMMAIVLQGALSGTAGQLYANVALTYWVLVSGVTVTTLWRAGRDQPTVARRRMRLISAATAVLAVALLTAVLLDEASATTQLVVQVSALASAVAFTLGLNPPSALRRSWRRPEEQQLQRGMMAVLGAGRLTEVAEELLPATVRIIGGSGAALIDARGRVMAAHGGMVETGAALDEYDAAGDRLTRQVVPLRDDRGALVVWTSPYTPFFGREEADLVRTMGAVAGLALERSAWLEEEHAQRVALEHARRAADRAREEATSANHAKTEFLSRMSHELRTPLNAILGFGQVLETADLSADDRDGLDHILKAGHHLLALINDVLDLSRIEAGVMTLSLEPVNADEMIADAAALIRPLARDRAITLDLSGGCETFVITDRQRCRQVLLNLLSNAVKYNRDGGTIEVRCRQADAAALRISVRDSGPGIPPGRRARLFEPFERLGAEESNLEGTGLGLTLTKHLVERMGGAIGVESAAGEGSTFWIDLPVTEQPVTPDAPSPRTQASGPSGQQTLLLVEDNLINLRVVQAMLRQRPEISVLPAMQGSLAIDLARKHQPDVIVLDLHLPDMSGREVLQRLRADPRTRDIPIVIASADATPGRVRQLLEDGAFAYLTKPLDLDRFLDVVGSALHRDGAPVAGTAAHLVSRRPSGRPPAPGAAGDADPAARAAGAEPGAHPRP